MEQLEFSCSFGESVNWHNHSSRNQQLKLHTGTPSPTPRHVCAQYTETCTRKHRGTVQNGQNPGTTQRTINSRMHILNMCDITAEYYRVMKKNQLLLHIATQSNVEESHDRVRKSNSTKRKAYSMIPFKGSSKTGKTALHWQKSGERSPSGED